MQLTIYGTDVNLVITNTNNEKIYEARTNSFAVKLNMTKLTESIEELFQAAASHSEKPAAGR